MAIPILPIPDGIEALVACLEEPWRGSRMPRRVRGVLRAVRDDPAAHYNNRSPCTEDP